MMRRAEGACRVLFMTSFSFSFCFSPFCCFCVENSGLEPGFNGRFVQSFANDDEHILPLRDGFQCSAGSGGVQLQPAGGALRVRCKALHPQHMAAGGIRKQVVGSGLQLLQRQVLLQKAQRAEGFVLVKMQLFAAGLPAAAGRNGGKVASVSRAQSLVMISSGAKRREHFAALQRTGQVGHGGSGLLLPGQLGTADQHPARVGRLGCQHILTCGESVSGSMASTMAITLPM
mgnify:CR=1 FL=1